MKSVWCIVIVASAVLGAAGPSMAQTRGGKPSPYTETPPPGLDKNYGLPTFGMPGYEPPKPKAVAPEANGTATGPDFYARTPESRFTLPRQTGTTGYSTTETPLYTTQEGVPAEDRTRTDTMEPDPTESDTLGDYSKTRR